MNDTGRAQNWIVIARSRFNAALKSKYTPVTQSAKLERGTDFKNILMYELLQTFPSTGIASIFMGSKLMKAMSVSVC